MVMNILSYFKKIVNVTRIIKIKNTTMQFMVKILYFIYYLLKKSVQRVILIVVKNRSTPEYKFIF